MSNELPEQTASPELQKFFHNLLELKKEVFILNEDIKNKSNKLDQICSRLHTIIKEKE